MEFIEEINLKFDLSSNGFLPQNPTPKSIRSPYDQWFNICQNLPKLIESHEIQEVILDLPLITIDNQTTHQEYQTIYSMLCMIQSAWLWHNGEGLHNHFVPEQIAAPLDAVSNYLGIKPLITHASVDLYNWELIDESKPPILDNLKSAFTLTGDISESWFYLIMVAIEHGGRIVLDEILKTVYLINRYPKLGLIQINMINNSLKIICSQITIFAETIKRMPEKCRPDHFYNVLRKFLSGWTNTTLFPKGVELEGIKSGVRYTGGSAAQSSLIQVIDIFLGIKHEDSYLTEMRNYMPVKHKEFLEWLETQPNIKGIVNIYPSLSETFLKCKEELSKFRSRHIGLVVQYIINVAKQNNTNSALAQEGTGGSNLIGFLKKCREETDI